MGCGVNKCGCNNPTLNSVIMELLNLLKKNQKKHNNKTKNKNKNTKTKNKTIYQPINVFLCLFIA